MFCTAYLTEDALADILSPALVVMSELSGPLTEWVETGDGLFAGGVLVTLAGVVPLPDCRKTKYAAMPTKAKRRIAIEITPAVKSEFDRWPSVRAGVTWAALNEGVVEPAATFRVGADRS